jgi:hypothetical protein
MGDFVLGTAQLLLKNGLCSSDIIVFDIHVDTCGTKVSLDLHVYDVSVPYSKLNIKDPVNKVTLSVQKNSGSSYLLMEYVQGILGQTKSEKFWFGHSLWHPIL